MTLSPVLISRKFTDYQMHEVYGTYSETHRHKICEIFQYFIKATVWMPSKHKNHVFYITADQRNAYYKH